MTRPEPFADTATERRELRRKVRNALGVSRDELPSPQTLMWAARDLSRLLWLTSGGQLRLAPAVDEVAPADWSHAVEVAMGVAEPRLPAGQLELNDDGLLADPDDHEADCMCSRCTDRWRPEDASYALLEAERAAARAAVAGDPRGERDR